MVQPSISPSHRRKRHKSQNDRKKKQGFDGIESMNARDYLARVKVESKGIPDILLGNDRALNNDNGENHNDTQRRTSLLSQTTQHHVPIEGSAASVSYLLSQRSSLTAAPSLQHLPLNIGVTEWTKSIIGNFERLRDYLDSCKVQGIGGKDTNRMPLPGMKDRASWHIFCLGADEASGNANSYYGNEYGKTDDRDADDNDGGITTQKKTETCPLKEEATWRKDLPANGYEPQCRLLLQMDQVMIRNVLSHLIYYINLGWSITSGIGRRAEWIFALLARLEKPIHRDDAAVLFDLLKKLTRCRSEINLSMDKSQDRCHLAQLNVLIVLVGVYFEQGSSNVLSG